MLTGNTPKKKNVGFLSMVSGDVPLVAHPLIIPKRDVFS